MKSLRILKLAAISTFVVICFSKCEKEDSNENPNPFIQEFIDEVSTDSLQHTVEWMQNMQTRFMLIDNRKNIAKKIQQKFIAIGYLNAQLDSFLNTRTYNEISYQTWQYNVVATLAGTPNTSEYNVLGAHYDSYTRDADLFTISPGANDNASGVAALIEIARLFKKNSLQPKKTIQFVAFAAEELGLYGSWDFAAKSSSNQHNISMMINFDMIAHWPESNSGNWTVNIIDYENSKQLRLEAEEICSTYTKLKTINDNADYNRSDSYLFYRYGYPAIFFMSSYQDNTYHTINDISSNCNYAYCREIVKASTALILKENI